MANKHGSGFKLQVQHLARNALALATGGVVAQLVFTFIEILIARKLGAASYGVFATAFAWVILTSHLTEVGTSAWMIQEGSRNHERIPRILGSSLIITLVMFGFVYALLSIVSIAVPSNAILAFLLVFLPYSLLLSLQSQLAAVYSAFQTMQVSALFQGGAPVAILVLYYCYAANDLTLTGVGFTYIAGSAIVTAAWFAYMLQRIRPQFSLGHVRTTLASSYPYGLSNVLGHVYAQSDLILLSLLAGFREAGIYAAAYKLVQLVSKVAVLSGRVFAPAIFKASHESPERFELFASMMTRILGIVGLAAGVLTVVVADDLIFILFGDKYAASVPVLRILGGVMAIKCMMVALQLLLSSIDMHFQRVWILGVTFLAHVSASAILIPRYGAIGASVAALFSGTFLVVTYAWASSRRRNFQYLRWLGLPSCLAVIVTAMALITDIGAITGVVAALSTYVVALYATRVVSRAEIMYVIRVLTKGENKP